MRDRARGQWTSATIAVVVTLSSASRSLAQDGSSLVTEGGNIESNFELMGPQNVPGRDTSPRVRPQPQPAPEPAPSEDRDWFGSRPWWSWERATGDWGGLRTRLEDSGLSIEASLTHDWGSVWSGGLSNRASTRTLFDINATLDMGQAFGWEGATLFADYYIINGNSISADSGDYWGVSNIFAEPDVSQLSELWLEQTLADGLLRIKAGKIEANAEFGFVDAGGEFLNSAPAYSPTIFPMVTYPNPATGVVVFVYPGERFSIGAGFFDGAATVDGVPTGRQGPASFFSDDRSDDSFLIAEAGWSWSLGGGRDGRVGAGAWHHTGEFATFDGGTQDGTFGLYALAEHRLLVFDPEDDEPSRGLSAFAQLGWGEDDVNEVRLHLAAGLRLAGTFHGRDQDSAGVYVSWLDLNDDAGFEDDETVLELFYRAQLTPSIAITPDLQYIITPGGDSTVDDALVAAVRLEITF